MSRPYDEVLRQNAAMERVQDLAAAHGFDADADAQQAVYEVLLDYAAQERQGLIAALAAEHADVLARRGTWRRARVPQAEMDRALVALGAERALHRVALRVGLAWDELRERAGHLDAEEVHAAAEEQRSGRHESARSGVLAAALSGLSGKPGGG